MAARLLKPRQAAALEILRAERWAALEDASQDPICQNDVEHRDYLMNKAAALSEAIDVLVLHWTGTFPPMEQRYGRNR